MVDSRKKGAAAENEIKKIFAKELGGDWARRSKGQKGHDIFAPDGFQYTTEVKHDKKIKVRHFFQPTKLLLSYWKQACVQTVQGKSPLLCIKTEGEWYAVTNNPVSDNGLTVTWGEYDVQVHTIEDFISGCRQNMPAVR